jgi:XTP/dITP diphosphohydrolase
MAGPVAVRRLVMASANPDKAAEILEIVGALLPDLEVAGRPADLADVVEDGETLLDNARLKAAAVAAATGEPALADDTGLEVAALGGAPGVYTARFAGEHATYAQNVAHLLDALRDQPDRRARFRTVAMVRWPDGREIVGDGAVDGLIATEARGEAGFGYDPVFIPDEGEGLTFSELGPAGKNRLSHRSRALRSLAAQLADWPAG